MRRSATIERASSISATPISKARPVMLATVDVVLAGAAVEFALESALEARAALIVCHAVAIPTGNPQSASGRGLGAPNVRADCAAVARRAGGLGIDTRNVLFNHPRPVAALIDATTDLGIGLFVFGSDEAAYGRWRYRRHLRRIRRRLGCLVWPLQ